MAPRRGRCIFCGIEGAMTREDPVPAWVAEVLRDMYPGTSGVRVVNRLLEGGVVVDEDTRVVGAADAYKLRVVCAACNNGWMSQLESKAKSVLEPMIRGRRGGLGLAGQKVVASWLTLKVLTFDLLVPEHGRTTSGEDFAIFYRDREPPRAFAAWLARFEGTGEDDMLFHHTAPISTGEADGTLPVGSPHSVRFTLSIGHLAMQAHFETEAARGYSGGMYWDDPHPQLVRVWPLSVPEVNWPPPQTIKPAGIPVFTGQALAGQDFGAGAAR